MERSISIIHAAVIRVLGQNRFAQFAAGGKAQKKKDLAAIAMSYGYVYVAQIAMGANYNQCVKAFSEAEKYGL